MVGFLCSSLPSRASAASNCIISCPKRTPRNPKKKHEFVRPSIERDRLCLEFAKVILQVKVRVSPFKRKKKKDRKKSRLNESLDFFDFLESAYLDQNFFLRKVLRGRHYSSASQTSLSVIPAVLQNCRKQQAIPENVCCSIFSACAI